LCIKTPFKLQPEDGFVKAKTCSCCVLLINPLNAQLNPICHLLALLGAHHILHVSRMRVRYILHKKVVLDCKFVTEWGYVTCKKKCITEVIILHLLFLAVRA